MLRGGKLVAAVAVFQVAFGLGVFGITRHIYRDAAAGAGASGMAQPFVLPDRIAQTFSPSMPTLGNAFAQDPMELARQADQAFSARQYDTAVSAYERLLAIDPGNVDTRNNLGLTLHYVGRSSEALRVLNEGVILDPMHQRSWLTLGFVNSQLGHAEEARVALTNAVKLGADNEVGRSAAEMLEALP